jgi:RNA polymerase sigma factor (sigma-70 family)
VCIIRIADQNRIAAVGSLVVLPSSVSESDYTLWLGGLRDGESKATVRLWNLYFERMMIVARRKLSSVNRAPRDEEDVALSAFRSFCLGMREGRFVPSAEKDNLWPLLVTLTINKAINHVRHAGRKKRGGETSLLQNLHGPELLDQLASNEPAPELVAATAESFERLISCLDESGDRDLRTIAILRMDGDSPDEIAGRLGCTVRTVQRKLKTIRAIWESHCE